MFLVYVYIYKLTHTHVPTYLIVLPQQNTSFDLWKKREQVSQLNELFVQPRQPETSISHIGEIIYFCYVLMILSENRVASMLILLLEIPYYVSYETFNCRGEGFLNYSNWHRSTVQSYRWGWISSEEDFQMIWGYQNWSGNFFFGSSKLWIQLIRNSGLPKWHRNNFGRVEWALMGIQNWLLFSSWWCVVYWCAYQCVCILDISSFIYL